VATEYPLQIRNRKPGDRISESVRLKTVLINDRSRSFSAIYLVVLADARGCAGNGRHAPDLAAPN